MGVEMKLGNVLIILIFISIQGGRTQAPQELQCWFCHTGTFPGGKSDCGDFGNLTQRVLTCPRGSACGKEAGKNDAAEKWTLHYCASTEDHHGRDGCWKWPYPLAGPYGRGTRQCRCSTDLCNSSGYI